jgi:hypothetical protein
MNTRSRRKNTNSVNGVDHLQEGDVALGRGFGVVSPVVIQRNLPTTTTTIEIHPISSNGNQNDLLQVGPTEHPTDQSTQVITQNTEQRNKWTKEEYMGIIEAYYIATETNHPAGMMSGMYSIWRGKNPHIHKEINIVKLNNQRNYIIKNSKLTSHEIETIHQKVKNELRNAKDNNSPTEHIEPNIPTPSLNTTPSNEVLGTTPTQLIQHQSEFEIQLLEKLAEVKCIPISERKQLNKIKYGKETDIKVKEANEVIKKILQTENYTLTDLNHLIYATANIISGERKTTVKHDNNIEPAWSRRISKQIITFRSQLSLISEYKSANGLVSEKLRNKIKKIMKKNIFTPEDITPVEQVIKMKLTSKSQRLQRYKKRKMQYEQNKLFEEDQKKLYRQLNKAIEPVTEVPKKENIEKFWQSILEDEKQHKTDSEWLKNIETQNNQVNQQHWSLVSINQLKSVLANTHNWKAPGPDKVQNFWLKKLTSTHQNLVDAYNLILETPNNTPNWLSEGCTYLLHKGKNSKEPKNYRPITCLPTMYKVLTSILSNGIYEHLIDNNIFPIEQKGCRKSSQGCKDQLLIDKMITERVKTKRHDISMAWIDYKKAFDSIPHSWILETLKIFKINPKIIEFIRDSMNKWKTQMHLYHDKGSITTKRINIKRGIFQGDSLSPLLFCLAITPLSQLLSREKIGYKLGNGITINHLLYMDDLKLYTKNDYQLEQALEIVQKFSSDIHMEFGLDKCAKISMKHGRVTKRENIYLNETTTIRELDHQEIYKYLGVDEHNEIQQESMKSKLKQEYIRRMRMVLRSELSSKNKIQAINSIALPVLQYSFGIIEWTENELNNLDRKTRKNFTMNGMHHPKADVHRLYLPRREGGRGLIDLVTAWKTTTFQLAAYIEKEKDILMGLVRQHENSKAKYSITSLSKDLQKKYRTKEIKEVKESMMQEKLKIYKEKPLHGQFLTNVDNKQHVNKFHTFKWLKRANLKGETESLIIAAQDQALNTRYHQKHILKQPVDSKCRLCYKGEEHVSHIVSGCSMLVGKQYLERHNRVATYIHWQLLKQANFNVTEKWYQHQPRSVEENDNMVIMWDFPIITDRTIYSNRPDIVYHDKNNKKCYLIDVAIPDDNNIAIKEAEKLSKYKDLEIEVSRMWKVQTLVIPVVIGALGSVTKRHKEHISKIPAFINIDVIQKTAILGTAHILRKFLDK